MASLVSVIVKAHPDAVGTPNRVDADRVGKGRAPIVTICVAPPQLAINKCEALSCRPTVPSSRHHPWPSGQGWTDEVG